MLWRELDGIEWLEAELPGAQAAFSTRLGGVSEGPFMSLNLGRLTGDLPDAVGENRHRLAAAVGIDPERVLIGRQVHGAAVVRRDQPPEPGVYTNPAPGLPEADGQATALTNVAPLVFVADCLPVALAGPGGVAMIHCGWRGLAAGIVERGVHEVEARAAAVGPGIGPCCYEVGQDVLAAFERLGLDVARGRMLNLRRAVRLLLERAGVESVQVAEECTSCQPALFFSHRRDGGRTGRQAGLVWASDEVAVRASEPAAPLAPEPAGNGGQAEASGGFIP
ncbi:MAG TPA: polyphenol oxidase family protein [Solirubrobacterales bacterium]|nr:polyphenol oxidase family protein [Solirubrobacterales bacterium]